MGTNVMAVVIAGAVVAMGEAQAANAHHAISWDLADGIAIGTGCVSFGPTPDTAIIATGADLAIVYSNLGVTGPGQIKNCSVRIPATIQQGFYVAQFEQTITYGVVKSFGTTAKITALASFFNQPVSSFTVDVPIFAMTSLAITETQVNAGVVINGCTDAVRGLFRADIAIGSQGTGEIVLPAEGIDLRYDIVLPVFLCPLP